MATSREKSWPPVGRSDGRGVAGRNRWPSTFSASSRSRRSALKVGIAAASVAFGGRLSKADDERRPNRKRAEQSHSRQAGGRHLAVTLAGLPRPSVLLTHREHRTDQARPITPGREVPASVCGWRSAEDGPVGLGGRVRLCPRSC